MRKKRVTKRMKTGRVSASGGERALGSEEYTGTRGHESVHYSERGRNKMEAGCLK